MMTYLSPLADLLMIAASAGAAIYCLILSRRLTRLTSFDSGIGGAIAVLSAQVEEMKAALAEAKAGTEVSGLQLRDLVGQARDIAGELELMIAACHDFAEEALVVQATTGPTASGTGESGPERSAALPEVGTVVADPAANPPVSDDPPKTPAPIFGTRRLSAPEPVFRRKAQV